MATKQKQQNLAQLFQAAIAGKKVSPSTKPAAKPKKGK